MAELCIKVGTVGPDPLYQDGDIIIAENDRMIQCSNLCNIICHPWKNPLTSDGLLPLNGIVQEWYERTHQYKFEQVSSTEVRKTNLWTLATSIVGPTPNADGDAIHLTEYIARRKATSNPLNGGMKKSIFGTPGSWVWYGGYVNASQANLDLVWNKVETDTPHRKVDWESLRPRGRIEMRTQLFLKVDDMDDNEVRVLQATLRDQRGDNDFPLLKRRVRRVPYFDIAGLKQKTDDIRDITKTIDERGRDFVRSQIVEVKA